MKLSEKQHQILQSIFIIIVLLCMFFLGGCENRKPTEDEKQMEYFKSEIQKRQLNKYY